MSWWSERVPQVAEPVAVADRVAEALARVRQLKSELGTLDEEMLAFKRLHKVKTNRFGILLSIECQTLTGRAVIETEWRALLTKRDKLVTAWHQALHHWASAKEAAK